MAGALVRAGTRSGASSSRGLVAALQLENHFSDLLAGQGKDFTDIAHGGARFSSSLAVPHIHKPVHRGLEADRLGVVATVFGATGFVGRYVVQQLARMGSQVMIPYRGVDEEWRHLKLMGDLGQIVPMRYDVRDEDSVKATIAGSNVIVNCIGKEYETRNFNYENVNTHNSERISRLAKEHGGIIKYIQMSCLGASDSASSRLLRSKAAAERVTMQNFPEATIMRTAAIVGTEDRLLNRWAAQAKKLPFVPIPGSGLTKLQPVLVIDVAAAVIAAVRDQGFSMGKTFELGGPDVFTINELVHLMFETIREHPRVLHIPIPLPRDYLDQLSVDAVVSPEAMGLVDLGITAHKIGGVTIEHLYAYRTGGPSVGATVGESMHGAGF